MPVSKTEIPSGLVETYAMGGLAESSRRVGEHGEYVETIRLTDNLVTVSYSGPPLSRKLRRELEAYWRDRLETIARAVFLGPRAPILWDRAVPDRDQSPPKAAEQPSKLPNRNRPVDGLGWPWGGPIS